MSFCLIIDIRNVIMVNLSVGKPFEFQTAFVFSLVLQKVFVVCYYVISKLCYLFI